MPRAGNTYFGAWLALLSLTYCCCRCTPRHRDRAASGELHVQELEQHLQELLAA